MRFPTFVTLASIIPLVVACTHLPPSPEERGVSVSDVVTAVQCELQSAMSSSPKAQKFLKEYRATVDLELKVVDNAGLSFNGQRKITENSGASTILASAAMSGKSTRITTLIFQIDMAKPIVAPCDGKTGLPAVGGSLGIESWLRSIVEAVDRPNTKLIARSTDTVYTVEFEVTIKGDIGINFVSTGFPKVGALFGADRSDKHNLTLALSPSSSGPPQETRVRIVNWPEFAARPDGPKIMGVNPDRQTRPRAGVPMSMPVPRSDGGASRRNDVLIERQRARQRTIIIE